MSPKGKAFTCALKISLTCALTLTCALNHKISLTCALMGKGSHREQGEGGGGGGSHREQGGVGGVWGMGRIGNEAKGAGHRGQGEGGEVA